MKRAKKLFPFLLLLALVVPALCVPAFAITEAEVEAQIAATSKSEVTGNVLIWFLCAVAFLKVSQKVDSLMASLGVNIGRTGGSLLAEAMIAMRSVTMITGAGRSAGGGNRSGSSSNSPAGGASGNSGWFMRGGLTGVVSRSITNSAVKTATTQTSAVRTAHSAVRQTAAQAAAGSNISSNSSVHTNGADVHSNVTADFAAPQQEGVIAAGGETPVQVLQPDGTPPIAPATDSALTQGGATLQDGVPPQENVISTVGDGQRGPEIVPPVVPSTVGAPPQEGVIVTDGEAPVQVPLGEGAAPPISQPDSAPPQDNVIMNGSEPPVSTVSAHQPEGIQSDGSSAVPPPQQEGVIVTGSEPPISTVTASQPERIQPDGSSVDSPLQQDGVDMTGSEPPVSTVTASQPEGIQPGVSSVDSASPQDGVIITDSGTPGHVPQTGSVPQDSPGSAPQPGAQQNVTVNGGVHRVETHTERASSHTTTSSRQVQTGHFNTAGSAHTSLGGMIFSRSLAAGGSFANDVIGTVARGEVAGSITGDMAAQSLTSYMGYAALGERPGTGTAPTYSDVEIGRGRITGVETAAGSREGVPFAMYHVDQYTAPSGEYSKVFSADGTQWYKQYAQDAVERKPYKAPDDTIAYHERIVKKLPNPPMRKDRI